MQSLRPLMPTRIPKPVKPPPGKNASFPASNWRSTLHLVSIGAVRFGTTYPLVTGFGHRTVTGEHQAPSESETMSGEFARLASGQREHTTGGSYAFISTSCRSWNQGVASRSLIITPGPVRRSLNAKF